MNLQSFQASPKEITFVRLLKSSMGNFPFGALCNFMAKMHTITTSNFGKLNLWMQISFIILFIIDLYKDNHVCACVRACVCAFVSFVFKKTSPQKLLIGLLPNFIVVFLR